MKVHPLTTPIQWEAEPPATERDLLAFDFRSSPVAIVMLPLEGMAPGEAIRLARSFEDFLERAFQRESGNEENLEAEKSTAAVSQKSDF